MFIFILPLSFIKQILTLFKTMKNIHIKKLNRKILLFLNRIFGNIIFNIFNYILRTHIDIIKEKITSVVYEDISQSFDIIKEKITKEYFDEKSENFDIRFKYCEDRPKYQDFDRLGRLC